MRIVGRRQETILRGGYQIYPREVEDQLRAHPAVDDVCVIGVPHDVLGELVCACIVPVEGAVITGEEIKRLRARHDGRLQGSRSRSLLRRFPMTGSGKVKRRELERTVALDHTVHHGKFMNSTSLRPARRAPPSRRFTAGPRRCPPSSGPIHTHAPNAALLIDFDNVTMGIRSDLQAELRNLLVVRHHQGQGRRAARLRRLAPLSAVHRAARRVVHRPDLGAGLRLVEEERDRHPPRDRRDRARVHAPRDRHVHPALRRLRLLEPRHQAQGVRQVRHRRRHPRVVERPARHELRRVLLLQRARRPREVRRRRGREVRPVGARQRGDQAHEAATAT